MQQHSDNRSVAGTTVQYVNAFVRTTCKGRKWSVLHCEEHGQAEVAERQPGNRVSVREKLYERRVPLPSKSLSEECCVIVEVESRKHQRNVDAEVREC